MRTTPGKAIEIKFAKLRDPRINRTKQHNDIDLVTIAGCAIICSSHSLNKIRCVCPEGFP